MVRASITGRNSSRPNIWMALGSVGENCCRVATAASTCAMAFFSNWGAIGWNTMTAASRVFHKSPAVENGIQTDSSSLLK